MTHEIEPAMTIREICLATGKSRATVYRMLRAGNLPAYRGPGGYTIPRQMFRRYLDGRWTPRPTQIAPVSLVQRRKAS